MVSCHALRPVPVRLPGQTGSPSRRGVASVVFLSRWLLSALWLPAWLTAAPFVQKFEPEPLVTPPSQLVFLDPATEPCFQDGGCLLVAPGNPLPAVLAVPLRRHLAATAAKALLPSHSRWLLAANHGSPLLADGVIPRAPQVGQRPRVDSVPFDLVTRADRLPMAAVFLIGMMLLLASSIFGLAARSPAEPAQPEAEPWIPEGKVLPSLVSSPVSPLQLRPRP